MPDPSSRTNKINRLLIANRGEIARRIMRSAHDMGIDCVAVFSDPDEQSPHVKEADLAVRLPGSSAQDTYLQIDKIIEAARKTGSDAIHPGYGFLSEDARFASACRDAGITFVGPSPEVISAMGSKLAAKDTMSKAGVPVLPTVTIGVRAAEELDSSDFVDDLLARSTQLTWPVLVKASAGGGGRGMRVVENSEDLVESVKSAIREATSAFGDGTVFLEPYAIDPRHIEVQIVGDSHGNVIHLNERECSIQRRHQKIIEESPSPAVSPDLRKALCDAAVTAAKTIGYVGAGTVEFILLQDGSFAFLEVNTRIQVEHPVTELVCGVDIVRLQLEIAQGQPLPVMDTSIHGHAIEVRLYAEDPTKDWQPSTGTLRRFEVPDIRGIRVDSGVENGSTISPFYDPMLAKIISYADTRETAMEILADALKRSKIHGVTTNRDLLIAILNHPEMIEGKIDTGFLVRHAPQELGRSAVDGDRLELYALAAVLARQALRREHAKVQRLVPSGWRNMSTQPQSTTLESNDGNTISVGYEFDRYGSHADLFIDGDKREDILYVSATPELVVLEHNGVLQRFDVDIDIDTQDRLVGSIGGCIEDSVVHNIYVDSFDGSAVFKESERFPSSTHELEVGSLDAPLPGTVIKVLVVEGQHVGEGELLFVLEAMKMEHEVRSPSEGQITSLYVGVGDQVEAGKILAVVSDDE